MYTIYRVVKKDISGLTYNAVDLGLPSGRLWADRNVGATGPEHYGSYFQWGDTNAYTFDGKCEVTAAELASLLQPIVGEEMEITADNVGMILEQGFGITGTDLTNTPMGALGGSLDKLFNWDSYFDTTDSGNTFNKYDVDKLTVLESTDDAAYVHMGSEWRMPTIDEITELIDNTTPTFIDIQGNEFTQEEVKNGAISEMNLKGIRLTGTNGNSIFIPAAGVCDEAILSEVGSYGFLWSSSLYEGDSMGGRHLYFDCDGYLNDSGYDRCCGRSVRGVQP